MVWGGAGLLRKGERIEGIDQKLVDTAGSEKPARSLGASGFQGMMVIPERVREELEGFSELLKGRGLTGEFHQGLPRGRGRGSSQGGQPPLGMIPRAASGSLPLGSAGGWELIVGALFPPNLPEVFEPAAGVRWSFTVQVWGQEACGAEEDGGARLGIETLKSFDRQPLGQESERKTISRESETVGEGFPKRLGETVLICDPPKPTGFLIGTVTGSLLKEGEDGFFGKLREGAETAPRLSEGLGKAGAAEGGKDVLWWNQNAGNFPVGRGPGEEGGALILEHHVQGDGLKAFV